MFNFNSNNSSKSYVYHKVSVARILNKSSNLGNTVFISNLYKYNCNWNRILNLRFNNLLNLGIAMFFWIWLIDIQLPIQQLTEITLLRLKSNTDQIQHQVGHGFCPKYWSTYIRDTMGITITITKTITITTTKWYFLCFYFWYFTILHQYCAFACFS